MRVLTFFIVISVLPASMAAEPTPAARGKLALESKAFIPGFWPEQAYDNAWKAWGVTEKPADYAKAFRDRYGLHEAPYANGKLPMGLRPAPMFFGKGLGIDCMTCHGGSIAGKSIVGLGNSSLDIHALFEELYQTSNLPARPPFTFSNVRGTNEAGAFAVYLLGYRTPDLNLKLNSQDLQLRDDSCEDVPAWWLLKKKTSMYHTGGGDQTSVRSIMQFMMHPLTLPSDFHKHEPTFKDIREYLLTIEPPKYPFEINKDLAAEGEGVFVENCAKCHGEYGAKPTYPNRIVPLADIGTDPKRYENVGVVFGKAYNESWFAKEPDGWFMKGKPGRYTVGYQAPPLDGIWATAPYFHNGSVPTLAGVLDSKTRPTRFTRSYLTTEDDYDKVKLGWKITEVSPPHPKTNVFEKRKIYDTTLPGRSNAGHSYGDVLTPRERSAVLEYLKTL